MKVYAVGDLHGDFRCLVDLCERFLEEGDVVLQVGDFGAGFCPDRVFDKLGKIFLEKGCFLYATRGNHDDPSYFSENRKFYNLEFLPDYTVKNLNGENFLFLGGAISVDRSYRTEGFNYWKNENFVLDRKLISDLRNIDRVISHTCPLFACPFPCGRGDIVQFYQNEKKDPSLSRDLIKEAKNIEIAFFDLQKNNLIKSFHFGHWHTKKRLEKDGCLFRCLDIVEIIMF